MKLKGYRTLIFSVAIAALGVIEQSSDLFGDNSGLVLVAVGLLTAYLRKATTGPVGKSE